MSAKFEIVGVNPDGTPVYAKRKGCRHWLHFLVFCGLAVSAGGIAPYYLIVWGICWLESKR